MERRVRDVDNAICSRTVPETIAEIGARGVRSRVGHTFVKTLMAEHEAVYTANDGGICEMVKYSLSALATR